MMFESDDLAICTACSSQYDNPLSSPPPNCKICDDPRQFVPPTGQAWTSLKELREKGTHNEWQQDEEDKRIWYIHSDPKVPIGQRAILLKTEHGNVLWDLIAYLDEDTIKKIKEMGGLKAIVISHPHYYTTHNQWAEAFDCPIYVGAEDKQWLCREDNQKPCRRFIEGSTEEIVPGVTAVKTGGHFTGSLVLHWEHHLLIADTIMTVPSGLYHINRPPGTISFVFMWSYPNMIPLPPSELEKIWNAIKPFSFSATHGAFLNQDVRHEQVKARILESMQIQIRHSGHENHPFLDTEM